MAAKLREAQRSTPENPAKKTSNTVRLDPLANQQLTTHAKKLKIGKSAYASAAVAYFAERGLNPTAELPQTLADIRKLVVQEARTTRVQQVDIGNRIISINKTWEKALYGFLQQQQGTTLDYLEQIESSILQHQVAIALNRLLPMIELMISCSTEAYIGRVIAERMNLFIRGKNDNEWSAVNKHNNDSRDRLMLNELREFIKTNNVPAPKPAPKPLVMAPPHIAPPAPITAPPTAGTSPK